jgi:hypothetical protein
VGEPYVVGTTATGLVKLSRLVGTREVHLVFGRTEAIAIADAIVDAVERPSQ